MRAQQWTGPRPGARTTGSRATEGTTAPSARTGLVATARRVRAAAALGVGVIAIIGASAIGLNDWADIHTTSASAQSAVSAPADQ